MITDYNPDVFLFLDFWLNPYTYKICLDYEAENGIDKKADPKPQHTHISLIYHTETANGTKASFKKFVSHRLENTYCFQQNNKISLSFHEKLVTLTNLWFTWNYGLY